MYAPEADALTRLGFREGSPNTHPGQGTACRRFFFRTSYLELVWVHNAEEAQSEPVRPTGLWDRWCKRREGASPFGIVLRRDDDAAQSNPPFPTRSYRPAYLPPGFSLEIALGVPLNEPALFWFAFQGGRGRTNQATDHTLGQTITRVRVSGPFDEPRSAATRIVEKTGLVEFVTNSDHIVELTLEDGLEGGTADLRPALPLKLRW